jgi:hypothetical protein
MEVWPGEDCTATDASSFRRPALNAEMARANREATTAFKHVD